MMPASAGRSIVLITAVQDREIDRVRGKLRGDLYRLVRGREDVRAVLEQLAQQVSGSRGECWLDLIGHSVEHGFLRLGDWVLDESAPAYFGDSLREALAALQVTRIRLLGCSTATTDRSWTVIRKIANCVGNGVEVFGTRRLIDEGDYNADGFIGLDAITGGNAIAGSQTRTPPPLDHPQLQALALTRCAKHTCFAATRHPCRSDAPDVKP